ncbi:MAG: hypothetical protein NW220_09310 [Leptolyngbyaceae cyanobacterium bins.349]|nr:hypothetical protein [Leptolyngbyaceae cyanobacterium bins.349]
MSFATQKLIPLGISVLALSACAANTTSTAQSTAPAPAAAPASPTATKSPPASIKLAKAAGAQHGGQVVEMGDYHLELLAAPEGEKIHVDFWLLTGANHAAIADATVVANIQFPNGTQKSVDLVYDQAGKHYKALVPGYAAGDYRVVVQTNPKGEKVNGRFNFKL